MRTSACTHTYTYTQTRFSAQQMHADRFNPPSQIKAAFVNWADKLRERARMWTTRGQRDDDSGGKILRAFATDSRGNIFSRQLSSRKETKGLRATSSRGTGTSRPKVSAPRGWYGINPAIIAYRACNRSFSDARDRVRHAVSCQIGKSARKARRFLRDGRAETRGFV